MLGTAPRLQDFRERKSSVFLTLQELEEAAQDWLFDCEYRQHAAKTLETRRFLVGKLLWFLKSKEHERCGSHELRQFLSYTANGHKEPTGRWGNPRLTKPISVRTIKDYHGHLRALFNYMVEQEMIEFSPMQKIAAPIVRTQQIQPLSLEQVLALLQMAEKSDWPRRDVAIISLLTDCGLRASELCGLKWKDLDLKARRCTVLGKGRKVHSTYFGLQTAKHLFRHYRAEKGDLDDPVFRTRDGVLAGGAMTRSGLCQLIRRLGKAAGIQAVRCSPHTLRHTFAVTFLRNGGQVYTLMHTLGHTNLQMTQKYVMTAEADIEAQGKMFSPIDRLKKLPR